MGNRPSSATTIATITLIAAAGVLFILGVFEFELIFQVYVDVYSVMATVAFALEIYALAISVLMFASNSKLVWYSSVNSGF